MFETGPMTGYDGKAISFMDRYAPYITKDKTVISRFGVGKVMIKQEPITLSIDGSELDTGSQIPSNAYPQEANGTKRDMYGRKIKEDRSRWAKIGEENFHLDVGEFYNKIAAYNRAMESRAEYEDLY